KQPKTILKLKKSTACIEHHWAYCNNNFFFMVRQQPSSTLFPYTTLFRSHPHLHHGLLQRFWSSTITKSVAQPQPFAKPGAGRRTDRKSTRLNSSHLVISYAVFCLKKKISNYLTDCH